MISGWIGREGLAWAVGLLLIVGVRADGPVAGLREYEVLRSFPPGRLAALTANDLPDAQGLTGGNRSVGKWMWSVDWGLGPVLRALRLIHDPYRKPRGDGLH